MTPRWCERAFVYFVPLCFLYLVTMWGLWHIPNTFWGMYGNTDGWWMAWNVEGILRWGKAFDFSPFNPLSGMGSMFAAYLPWLNPGAFALGLPFAKDLNYVISYSIFFAEVCISNIFLLRALGLSPLQSSIGAQMYVLVLFPPSSGAWGALPWYSLAPTYGHLVAVANFTLVLFLVIGRYRPLGNLACAIGMLTLIAGGLFSAPVSFLTYAPTYGLAGLALLVGERWQRQALLWKLGAIAAVGTAVWLAGFPDYIRAMAGMSARAAALSHWVDLWRRFSICDLPQALFCNKRPVFWFHGLALVGTAIALFKGRTALRPLAAWFLAYVAFILFHELASYVGLFGSPQILSAPYLVWSLYPFFTLFFAVFWCAVPDLAARALHTLRKMRLRAPAAGFAPGSWGPESSVWTWSGWSALGKGLFVFTIPALSYYLWMVKIAPYQPGPRSNTTIFGFLGPSYIRKPALGPVTRYLIEQASLKPGAVFRGYTVSYFGDISGHIRKAVGYREQNMSWDVYVRARHYLDDHYGNLFQETDLWEVNIPTFEEYGQWVTRQAYVFATELFSSPGDEGHPVFLRIYRLDLDLLPALGVRFLITDMQVGDPRLTLRAEERVPPAGPIYLYELADPNLATYSPTRPLKVATFAEALALIRQHRDTLRTDVVVFEDQPGPFRPARRAELRMERDGFRITAESDGRSLVLVPVQFSRCFRMQPVGSAGDLAGGRLLRANGIQTLLEFQGRIDARVRFEFGLLGAAQCRLQDVRELDALELKR